MAGVALHITSDEIACSTTPKTVLQVKAATNQRVLISKVSIMGKAAAGGTDTPSKLRLTRSTANFGTGTSVTPQKNDPNDGETVQTTAASNFSVEPTSPTAAGIIWEINPQVGYTEFFPPDGPIKVPGGQALNFEITAQAGTPTFVINVDAAE